MKAQDYLMLNARTMTEAQFQSAIITLATRLGWMHYHTHDSRRSPAGRSLRLARTLECGDQTCGPQS